MKKINFLFLFCGILVIAQNKELLYPVMIRDINALALNSNPSALTPLGNKLFFTAENQQYGRELWVTDSNTLSTSIVKDINPSGSSIVENISEYSLPTSNNFIFFIANDGVNGNSLWKSDGTTDGTSILLNPDSPNASFYLYGVFNDKLYFKVDSDGNGTTEDELWISDGSINGTFKILNRNISQIMKYNNDEVYITTSKIGTIGIFGVTPIYEIWKYSNKNNSIMKLEYEIEGGAILQKLGDYLLLIKGDSIVKYDGNSFVTIQNFTTGSGGVGNNFVYNNEIYFEITLKQTDGSYKRGLYSTDGTINGMSKVADLTGIERYTIHKGILYFTALEGTTGGYKLFRTDGTSLGTYKISGNLTYTYNLCSLNNYLFFTSGGTLYRYYDYDNTVKEVANSYGDWIMHPNNLKKVGDKLFFNSGNYDNKYGNELYFLEYPFGNKSYSLYLSNGNISHNDIMIENGKRCTYDVFGNLIICYSVEGTTPVNGNLRSIVWVDNPNNYNYVKRHYELTSENNPNTSTSKVNLFFTQEDFNDFNSNPLNLLKLPTNPNDDIGKSNLKIEKFNGKSNLSTGLPNCLVLK